MSYFLLKRPKTVFLRLQKPAAGGKIWGPKGIMENTPPLVFVGFETRGGILHRNRTDCKFTKYISGLAEQANLIVNRDSETANDFFTFCDVTHGLKP